MRRLIHSVQIAFVFLCLITFHGIHAQSNQWAWMTGSNTPNSAGNYGAMGFASASNEPPARYAANVWTDNNGKFWMFGGYETTGPNRFNDLWMFDPTTNMWTWMNGPNTPNNTPTWGTQGVPAPGNNPGYRQYGGVTWCDKNNNLWLFAGFGGTGAYADLWEYLPSLNEWVWMKGPNTNFPGGSYGTQGVAAPSNYPSYRFECASSWVDAAGDLWFFGGQGNGLFNDLWRFNIASNNWTWMSGSQFNYPAGSYGTKGVASPSNSPPGRMCHTSWLDQAGNFWIFGGNDSSFFSPGTGMLNDLWKYDPVANMWTWMSGSNAINQPGVYGTSCTPDVNNIPSGRIETRSCWTDHCGNFWMFGGGDDIKGQKGRNDLWTYNPNTNQWAWVNGASTLNQAAVYGSVTVPAAANHPGARMGSVCWIGKTGLYMFGGGAFAGPSYFSDMWKYYPDKSTPNFSPSPLSGCTPLTVTCTNTTVQNCGSTGVYSWNFGDPASGVLNTSTSYNGTHTYNTSGTYTIKMVISNCFGLKDSITKTVTAGAGITATATNTPSNCAPAAGTATGTPTSGTGPYTYSWSNTATTQTITNLAPGVYTVVITDASGCSVTKTDTVKAGASPPATSAISGTSPVCAGTGGVVFSVTNTPGSTYNWTVPGGATITAGQGTNSITVTFGATGGTVSVTETNVCGPGTPVNFTEVVNTIPTSSAITGTSPVCAGATGVVFSVTNHPGNTYNWTVPGGASITSGQGTNSITVTFGSTGGTVTCTESDGCGAGTPVTFNVTITPLPVTSAITGPSPVCPGAVGMIYSVTNNPGSTYNWTVPGGASITAGQGTNSITVTFGASGGTITCTQTNSCGSATPVTFNVTTSPTPVTSAITGTSPVCPGATGIVYSVTNTPGSTYNWTVPGGASITAGQGTNSITVSFGASGGTITCTETSACGSGAPVTFNVTLGTTPVTPAITGTSPVCPGATGVVYSVTNNPGSTYNWTVPAGATITSGQGTNSITVSFGASGGTISCTQTSACGTSAPVTFNVVTSTLPVTSSITGTNPVCPGATGIVYSVTNNPGSTYAWTVPAGATITSGQGTNSITVSFGATAGTITCTQTSTCGNSAPVSINVTTSPAPVTSSITGTSPVCPGASGIVYSVTNSPGSTYNWNVPAGASITSGQGTNSITVTFGASGGTVSCTETNSCGTGTPVTFNVATSPTPVTSAITGTSPLCPNATGIVFSVTNTAGSTYNWTVPAGASITSGQGTNSIAVTFGNSGGTVTVTETNSCGNGTPVTFNVVMGSNPVTSAITGPASICVGATGQVFSVTNTPGSTYSWTVPAGSSITSGQGSNSITVNCGPTGGTVSCTETNSCGSDMVTSSFTILPLPVATITGGTVLCSGDTVLLNASGGGTYSWSNSATTASIHVTTPGTYSVTVSNACGSATASTVVTGSTVVSHFTTDSLSGYVPLNVHFTNNSSSNVTTWTWNFGDGGTGTGPDPSHVYNTAGTYTAVLIVTDANGCTSKYDVIIHVSDVNSFISVPNVFTPNDDGYNDVLYVQNRGIATFDMKIYDRWGVLLNEFTNPSQGWDGRTTGGVRVTDGTYYYLLIATGADGKQFNQHGYISLLK
ncbi:MAG: kelch repeat-containing protein [Bacteroidia bacterium]